MRASYLVYLVIVAGLIVSSDGASLAQSAAPSQEGPQTGTGGAQSGTTTGQGGESLSDKLDRSRGVIQPPANVDPDIQVPAPEPNPGTTRVIPPPGTPGGDQSVVPK